MMPELIKLKRFTGTPRDARALQAVFDKMPRYFELTTQAVADENSCAQLFSSLPPGKTVHDKFVYGIYLGEQLIGCIDLVRGYPNSSTAMLGLLALSENAQAKGYGSKAYEQLEAVVREWPEIETIRIGVVKTNDQVFSFWKRLGFVDTGIRKPYESGKVISENCVFEKTLMDLISVSGGVIAAKSFGAGVPVIFLHGGPGDTHHYMRRMAEPLVGKFQCIFFDQRGTGSSTITDRVAEQFSLEHLFQDILAVKNFYHLDSFHLVGHSWGAMYALYFALRYPELVKGAALLNAGPLDEFANHRASENALKHLSVEETQEWRELRSRRNEARDLNDTTKTQLIDKALMKLRVKGWIYHPEFREAFLVEYFRDPPPDRKVNQWIWQSQSHFFQWDALKQLPVPVFICAGENDYLPIEQAEKLERFLPNSKLVNISQCGHMPWLDQPAEFYRKLIAFLSGE